MDDFDIVYGVVGLKAAGKGAFGDRLAASGFTTMTLSAPIKVIAQKEIGPSYEVFDLMRIGNEGRRLHGAGHWAEETLLLAKRDGIRRLVIDGLRNPGEIHRLRDLAGPRLVLVGITASAKVRFARLVARGKDGDPKDMDGFLAMDDRDRGINQPADGQQVDRTLAEVPHEHLFVNDGTIAEFHAWIDARAVHDLAMFAPIE